MIFKGKVEGGGLKLFNRQEFVEFVKKFDGKILTLDVKEQSKSRSINQNNYYWGVIIEILAKEWGYGSAIEKKTLSSLLADMFIPPLVQEIKIGDELVTVTSHRGTSDLNTKEFEEYAANIRRWASAEYQIYIPEPNETDYYSLT